MAGTSKILLWSVSQCEQSTFFNRLINELNSLNEANDATIDHQLRELDGYNNELHVSAKNVDQNIDGYYSYKRIKKKEEDKKGEHGVSYVHYLIISSEVENRKKLLREETGTLFFIIDYDQMAVEQNNDIDTITIDSEDNIDFEKYKNVDLEDLLDLLLEEEETDEPEINERRSVDYLTTLEYELRVIHAAMMNSYRRDPDWSFFLIILNSPSDSIPSGELFEHVVVGDLLGKQFLGSFQQLKPFFKKISIYPITKANLKTDKPTVYWPFSKVLRDIEKSHWRSYQCSNILEKFLFGKPTGEDLI